MATKFHKILSSQIVVLGIGEKNAWKVPEILPSLGNGLRTALTTGPKSAKNALNSASFIPAGRLETYTLVPVRSFARPSRAPGDGAEPLPLLSFFEGTDVPR